MNEISDKLKDDKDLHASIQKASLGPDADLGRLLDSFGAVLSELADRNAGDAVRRDASVSDQAQETILTTRDHVSEYRGHSTAEYRGWLNHLFHTRLISGFRRLRGAEYRHQMAEKNQVDPSTLADSQLPPSVFEAAREDSQYLLQLLQQLPNESQNLIRLRYIENLPFEIISKQTGVPIASLWQQFQEAIAFLHQHVSSRANPLC